jgi:hypothetical protein
MDMQFEELPTKFSAAILLGEVQEAICYADGKSYIITLDNAGRDIREITQAFPLHNVNMRIGFCICPLELTDVSREDVLEKLRFRSKQFAPLTFLEPAMSREISHNHRVEGLVFARQRWSEEGAAFTRIRLLSAQMPEQADAAGTIKLCRDHGYPEFIPLLEEVAEAVPFMDVTVPKFIAMFGRGTIPSTAYAVLMDKGVLAEATLGLARNDFSRLDQLIEQLDNDPQLKSLQPAKLLGDYTRYLRDSRSGEGAQARPSPQL